MSFTEWYVRSDGDDTFAGSGNVTSADVTETNGDWDNAASERFTAASGTPFSGVSVGDWAAIMIDAAGATPFVGRVSVVNGGGASIDIHATARFGTKPTASASARTCKIGGAWATPAQAFGFITNLGVDTSGDPPRVNLKAEIFDITSSLIHTAGTTFEGITFQGYTTTAGDGGKATIRGPATGATIVLIEADAGGCTWRDLIITRNGDSGNTYGMRGDGLHQTFDRILVHSITGSGLLAKSGAFINESEFHTCNQGNSGDHAGVYVSNGDVFISRSIFHDNVGTGADGIRVQAGGSVAISDSILDNNGRYGVRVAIGSAIRIINNTINGNGDDGIHLEAHASNESMNAFIDNIITKNGGYGIGGTTNAGTSQFSRGNAFKDNTSGEVEGAVDVGYSVGNTSLTSDPMVDEANGNFTPNTAEVKEAAQFIFLQDSAKYSKTTTSFPDTGAVIHEDPAGGNGAGPGILKPLGADSYSEF